MLNTGGSASPYPRYRATDALSDPGVRPRFLGLLVCKAVRVGRRPRFEVDSWLPHVRRRRLLQVRGDPGGRGDGASVRVRAGARAGLLRVSERVSRGCPDGPAGAKPLWSAWPASAHPGMSLPFAVPAGMGVIKKDNPRVNFPDKRPIFEVEEEGLSLSFFLPLGLTDQCLRTNPFACDFTNTVARRSSTRAPITSRCGIPRTCPPTTSRASVSPKRTTSPTPRFSSSSKTAFCTAAVTSPIPSVDLRFASCGLTQSPRLK